MNSADNPKLNYIALKLALAISSGQGDAFCHEYDQYDNTKLTQEQVEWIKEKARKDSALPKPTLDARMRWYKDKVVPKDLTHDSYNKPIQDRQTDVKLSDETVNEFNKSRNTLKSRMESLLNNPQMKKFESDLVPDAQTVDVNKNYPSKEEQAAIFNGFHDIEMVDMSGKNHTKIDIDDSIDFGFSGNSGEAIESKKRKKKKKRLSEVTAEPQDSEKKGLTRAQRRKKLKEFRKEKDTPSERGNLESQSLISVATEPISIQPEVSSRKSGRGRIKQYQEMKRNARTNFFAQGQNGELIPLLMLGNPASNLVLYKNHEKKLKESDSQKSTYLKSQNLQKKAAKPEKEAEVENTFPSWVLEHDSKVEARKKKKEKSYRKHKNREKEVQNEETNSDHSAQGSSDKSQPEKSQNSGISLHSTNSSSTENLSERQLDSPTNQILEVLEMAEDVSSWDMVGKKSKVKTKALQPEIDPANTPKIISPPPKISKDRVYTRETPDFTQELWPDLTNSSDVTSNTQPDIASKNSPNSTITSDTTNESLIQSDVSERPGNNLSEEVTLEDPELEDKLDSQNHATSLEVETTNFEMAKDKTEIEQLPDRDSKISEFDDILGSQIEGLNFLVASCDDISELNNEIDDNCDHNGQCDLRFVFVDQEVDQEISFSEENNQPENLKENLSNAPLTGEFICRLLANHIPDKEATESQIPDCHSLIKFQEKRWKSVLEREQKGSAKIIRYVS